ncbi:unnamed protein product [Bursaphelenchus xylophilus]|uniref:(pine wood nematode) hypothetical protein n=1 Tax=Bursaphelenchus xylophilus TaxID=6326 RepID=A0A1I7S948_BURXY|nr:unnamed protein product [Bursaphelenchus xylophilus]CAG9086260.1 unnamed protein product [Bursaphelenchus xylophilus]
MDWKRKIWLSAGFAIFTGVTLRVSLFVQEAPSIYQHKPGKCKHLPQFENGVLTVTESRTLNVALAFHAVHKNVRVHIIPLKETKENMNNISLQELYVTEWKDSERFHPISAHIHVEGSLSQNKYRAFVYVLNRQSDKTSVEVFELRLQKLALLHLQTIEDATFDGSTDISVLSPGRFVLVKPHYFSNPYLQVLEVLFYRGYGQLLMYNGKTTVSLERGLQGPTSLFHDPQTSRIFLGLKYSREILVYELRKDFTLIPITTIGIMSSPTKIISDDKDLWVGASPAGHIWSDKSNSSHILRIRFQDDAVQSWVITESFASTSALWSKINGLIITKNGFLITSAQTAAFCNIADLALV